MSFMRENNCTFQGVTINSSKVLKVQLLLTAFLIIHYHSFQCTSFMRENNCAFQVVIINSAKLLKAR